MKTHNHKYSFGKPMVHGCPACEQTEQETRNRLMRRTPENPDARPPMKPLLEAATCRHCKRPRSAHAGFARCDGGATQYEQEARFQIGTKFESGRGAAKRICTVTDVLRTYNNAGELVRIGYVASHEFMGQTVTDHNVIDATIAKGLLREVKAEGGAS